MIICISGPSSTGKTTLINELKDYKELIELIYGIGRVQFSTEYIRDYVEKEYPNKTFDEIISVPENAIQLQFKIADITYNEFIRMLKDRSVLYICDRCPLDNLVYNILNYHCNDRDLMIKYSEEFSRTCSIVRSLSNYVDRIYLTQVDVSNEKSVVKDGFRPESYEYRRQLEVELFNSIFEFNPKVCKIPSSRNDRISTILQDLSIILNRR